MVQPLAPAQLPNEATGTSPSAPFASAGLTFKHLGEGARSGNAATVATLQLASSHAGGASGLAFRHRHHAAFRRARARSCHTQLTLSACRPHWREVVLSSSCASERVRRSPQCGGSRDCQAPSQWRRALPCWVYVTVHPFGVARGVQQHCFHWARHILQCWAWPPCGLLHMVRMSFGRVIGRDHVNCA